MSKPQKRYTPELRSEAVKLVLEQGIQQSLAARRLGISEGTLVGWVAAAKKATPSSSVPDSQSAAELFFENAKYAKSWQKPVWSVRSLKKRRRTLKGVAARYAFMKKWRFHYPVTIMCVNTSIYCRHSLKTTSRAYADKLN